MGEDEKVQYSTSNIANGYSRMELETESAVKEEPRRQKRKKLAIILAVFTVFQIAILLIFILVVMKIRTPQFRVKSGGTFGFVMNSDAGGTNPSFNLTMYPNIRIKNTNFGPYKYEEAKVQFFYRGSPVGSVVVHKSKVGMRSTKKVINGVAVEVSSTGMQMQMQGNLVNELANDLSLGKLALTSEARLDGKVEMLFIIKKKKSIHMNCSMELDVFTREFHQINCN